MEQVQISLWYQTLFYGLKVNHPHNVAVVHPLSFLLRRIVYSLVIVCSSRGSAFFSSLVMLLIAMFMIAMVASEAPWVQPLINRQHLVNEIVYYVLCVCLVCFSGMLTSTR